VNSTPGAVVQRSHTADLDPHTLGLIRQLMDDAFGSDYSDHDWEHALGGMHALAWLGDDLVAHASVVQRRLIHRPLDGSGQRALRCGFVESVAVRAGHQRGGLGSAVMEPLERVIEGAYELGALGASAAGARLYRARGWQQWRGATWALTPEGRIRTAEEDDDIWVLQPDGGVVLDLEGDLTCDWRDGDVW